MHTHMGFKSETRLANFFSALNGRRARQSREFPKRGTPYRLCAILSLLRSWTWGFRGGG
jgi:hypothetical protein